MTREEESTYVGFQLLNASPQEKQSRVWQEGAAQKTVYLPAGGWTLQTGLGSSTSLHGSHQQRVVAHREEQDHDQGAAEQEAADRRLEVSCKEQAHMAEKKKTRGGYDT